MAPIAVTHFTDPGCPWAYSAWPYHAALMWRYGDQLDWTLVTIGLREEPHPEYTPARQAAGWLRFRTDWGMPFQTMPADRGTATGRACRLIVAARLHEPAKELAVFRGLQRLRFASTLLFDSDEGFTAALGWAGVADPAALIAAIDTPEVEEAYQADRTRTRQAAGTPTEFQDRHSSSDGPVRYTAPSVIFTTTDGASLEVGGFQPLEAYDTAIANLDRSLTRRGTGDDVTEILGAFEHPLTTAEVDLIRTHQLARRDRDATEAALITAAEAGAIQREAVGSDAWWSLV